MQFGIFRAEYETTLGRAALALIAGAGMGVALLTAIVIMFDDPNVNALVLFASQTAPLVFGFLLTGLVIVGAPIWWCLHRLGLRGWGAMVFGAALGPYGVLLIFFTLAEGPAALPAALRTFVQSEYAAAVPAFGAMGAVIWAVAYRRPPSVPSADIFE